MKIRDFLNELDPRAKSWHPQFILSIVELIKPESYLEVGIYRGETLRKVAKRCNRVVGIDIDAAALQSVRGISNAELFLGTAQQWARSNTERFDLVFIDANHHEDAVVADFTSVEAATALDGFILMHDTWPKNQEFASEKYCGSAYRAVDRLRGLYPGWNFVTISAHPGLTMAQRVGLRPKWVEQG